MTEHLKTITLNKEVLFKELIALEKQHFLYNYVIWHLHEQFNQALQDIQNLVTEKHIELTDSALFKLTLSENELGTDWIESWRTAWEQELHTKLNIKTD